MWMMNGRLSIGRIMIEYGKEIGSCPHGKLITDGDDFSIYGLNVRDFLYLKWDDEPVEVFINLED